MWRSRATTCVFPDTSRRLPSWLFRCNTAIISRGLFIGTASLFLPVIFIYLFIYLVCFFLLAECCFCSCCRRFKRHVHLLPYSTMCVCACVLQKNHVRYALEWNIYILDICRLYSLTYSININSRLRRGSVYFYGVAGRKMLAVNAVETLSVKSTPPYGVVSYVSK